MPMSLDVPAPNRAGIRDCVADDRLLLWRAIGIWGLDMGRRRGPRLIAFKGEL
jgi:hypothetical protein